MISKMRLYGKCNFLTFVLFVLFGLPINLAFSAPLLDVEPTPIEETLKAEKDQPDVLLTRTRNLALSADTLAVSLWIGKLKVDEDPESSLALSYFYTKYADSETAFEWGVDFLKMGAFGPHLAWKKIWVGGLRVEPFLKVGAGALYLGSDGLPTFINWNRYHIRVSSGFENLAFQRRLRLEAGGIYAQMGTAAFMSVGWSF